MILVDHSLDIHTLYQDTKDIAATELRVVLGIVHHTAYCTPEGV